MDLTILKSGKNLSDIEPIRSLNYKKVTVDSWTELLTYRIALSFDHLLGNFEIHSVDVNNKLLIHGYIYILIKLREIQFVIYAISLMNSKENIDLRNTRITKWLGYGVDKFEDTLKYFHVISSTPTRLLGGTEVDPIGIYKKRYILLV
jgi:hypothetical protein